MKADTVCFDVVKTRYTAEEIVKLVHLALQEKGYNPEAQFAGYLLTGDPTYITNHKNARALINNIDRYELINEIIKKYFQQL